MKSKCTIKIMRRETKLGCICNRTGFFNNCTVKLLDEICEQEINIQHLKYSASHTVSHSQCSSLWVKSPVTVWEVIGIWFWVCFWAKSLWQIISLTITFLVASLLVCLCVCTNTCNHAYSATPSTSSENTILWAQIMKWDSKRCVTLTQDTY